MKAFICAITILAIICSAAVFGAAFTSAKLSVFIKEINAAIPEHPHESADLYAAALIIEQEYESIGKYLRLFIHDSEAREIEEHIADIKSAAQMNETADAIAAKNRLLLHIEQLRRLSVFSPEAVF